MPYHPKINPPHYNPRRVGGFSRYDAAPKSRLVRPFWRMGVLLDAHFAADMLQWWEALIVAVIVIPLTTLFWFSAYKYFPAHWRYLERRLAYYIFEDETVDVFAAFRATVAHYVYLAWTLARAQGERVVEGIKEAVSQIPAATAAVSSAAQEVKVEL